MNELSSYLKFLWLTCLLSTAGLAHATCGPGYFTSYIGGREVCTTAAEGYPASVTGKTGQEQCVAGTYWLAGQGRCTICPDNSTSSDGASTCSSVAGYFKSVVGTTMLMTKATQGHYAAAGATAQTACPANSTSPAGASTCTAYAGYYYTASTNTVTQAAAGYYAAYGSTSQTACPTNTYSKAASSSCSRTCPTGTTRVVTTQGCQ